MDTLFVNNDHVIEIQALREADGTLVPSAVVEATLYLTDGVTPVPGVSWPLTLTYTGAKGTYRGELGAGVGVTAGSRYTMKLTAVYAGKQLAVTRTVRAEERDS